MSHAAPDAGLNPDWAVPWFKPYAAVGEPVRAAWARGSSLPEALNGCAVALNVDVRFASQAGPMSAAQYESRIASAGVVPTRNNWHDFFNGLVWLRFPAIKRALNRLQADALTQERAARQVQRSRLRDALTIFDENAVLLDGASAQLIDDLKVREWQRAFEQRSGEWRDVGVTVFGHALLDQLRTPRINLTGHLWLGSRPPTPDELLRDDHRTPLVILGIPNWAAHAGLPLDLGDATVFRPLRRAPQTAASASGEAAADNPPR